MKKPNRNLSFLLNFPVAASVVLLLCSSFAWAGARGKIIYPFAGGTNAAYPGGAMIFDGTGSLYGLAAGGANNVAAVFKLTPSGSESWTESLIYSFLNFSNYPGPNIVFDASGNLYGSFASAGSCGAIYQLTPGSGGIWTEATIFSFTDSADQGCYPANLIFDPSTGRLYGETQIGGAFNGGAVFALEPAAGGVWNFNLIYSFGSATAGDAPTGPLTLDSSGSLYGTTLYGGSYSGGTVYKLSYGMDGWTETTLYNFTGGYNGNSAGSGVIFDGLGNLYGTTNEPGGGDDVGNVYKLTPTKGEWVIHVIHTFTGGPDGGDPSGYQLAIDGAGNLYGTTARGGLYNYGAVFRLVPSTGGRWRETVLHAFTNGADGGSPYTVIILGSSGNLYGTAYNGGTYGYGVAFEIRP
jgi:uncharacterized repeat protein (TIGR03803 family)